MVRGTVLPEAEKAGSTNRKKHRAMRVVMSSSTMFLTENCDWEKHKVYDTESEANTALDGFFVQSEVTGE